MNFNFAKKISMSASLEKSDERNSQTEGANRTALPVFRSSLCGDHFTNSEKHSKYSKRL